MQQGSFLDPMFAFGSISSPPGSVDGSQRDSTGSGVVAPVAPDAVPEAPASAPASADWLLGRNGAPPPLPWQAAPTTELGEDARALHASEWDALPVRAGTGHDGRAGVRTSGARSSGSEVWPSRPTSPTAPVAASDAASLLSHKSSHASLHPRGAPARHSSRTSVARMRARRGVAQHPALLSEVARAFVERITTGELTKHGLAYVNAFDGRQAVDKLAAIARTNDRNLALLLGRALDAQKLFHDVTYDHRLRDSPNELYQFTCAPVPAGGVLDDAGDAAANDSLVHSSRSSIRSHGSVRDLSVGFAGGLTPLSKRVRDGEDPDATQYSLDDDSRVLDDDELWAESVPREVYDSVPERERKRQEVIFEVIATERGYVHDLEYVRDYWLQPLSTQHIIARPQRAEFVQVLFQNLPEILAVNQRVAELLTRRQKQRAVVECIGDIYLDMVDQFVPYVTYGANQMHARLRLESEKATNPFFALFVADTERKAASRKLELNGYLTKPTTRLARYPLLFEQVLKYTDDDSPDKVLLPVAIQKIKALLSRVNDETGRNENRLQISQLSDRLVFKPGETVDLRLRDENRELVFKGTLKKRSGTQSDNADIHVYLFDHALLMVKHKIVHKNELEKVYRKPIPLELLQATVYEEVPTGKNASSRIKSVMSRSSIGKRVSLGPSPGQPTSKQDAKTGFAITFTYLGRKGYSLTLWASTYVSRTKWFEHIEARQAMLRERSQIFDVVPLSQLLDTPQNRITCAVPFDFGRQILYGRGDGVYLSDLRADARAPAKVLPLPGVTQVDVLEEYQILIVLAEQSVYTFTLDALDPADPVGSLKRGRRISSHTTFFRAGVCLGRTLVCVVKSGPVSSTIKTLEPIERDMRVKKQPTFRKLLQGGQDSLRVFKEFYIPTESSSIHFLKSKLCIGTTKGFEIVDLETLDTQGLLDPADASLEFVQRRENLKPIAIYRIEGEFLLCYNEFAFYVNKNGWRAKGNWIIHWEGHPTSFALHHPYVLAFEPSFIEVRHVETGVLHQVITGHNLQCIFADSINASPSTSRGALGSRAHAKPMYPARVPMNSFAAPGAAGPFSPASIDSGFVASPSGSLMYANLPGSPPSVSTGVPGSPYANSFAPSVTGMQRPSISGYSMQSATSGTSSPKPHNPVMESVLASRNHIVFVGDSSVYSVRLHQANAP
ncbi:ROM2 [Malassezia furfur]|nr:ROM2 [Malassezia furfur]